MTQPQFMQEEVTRFLRVYFALTQAGNITLAAIPSAGGAPVSAQFSPAQTTEACNWARAQQAEERNIYFQPNPCLHVRTKARASDVSSILFRQIDLDPIATADYQAERERLLGWGNVLCAPEHYKLPPSAAPALVWDSGNGVQALWLAQRADNSPAAKEQAERENKALGAALGGDPAVSDISRLMRLPGTANYPNASKRQKGRTITQSRLIHVNRAPVYITDFKSAAWAWGRLAGREQEVLKVFPPPPPPMPAVCPPAPTGSPPALGSSTQTNDHAALISALECLKTGGANQSYETWQAVGGNLKACVHKGLLTEAEGLRLWHDFSAHEYAAYDWQEVEKRWENIGGDAAHAGLGSLINRAKAHGWTPPQPPPGMPDFISAHSKESEVIAQDGLAEETLCRLVRTKAGAPYANLDNAATILECDPRFNNLFSFNEMTQRPCIKPPGAARREITPEDMSDIQRLLQRAALPAVAERPVEQAVMRVAACKRFHPVRDWLTSLAWDGTPRLDRLMSVYFGAEESEYHRLVGRKFMIALVARVMQPGCKMDTLLILEGTQGAGKSRAARALGGEYFSDHLPDITRGKEASEFLAGKWLVELAELNATKKAEAEALKSFLSRQEENYRPAYGRSAVRQPRQCVFIGTTNESEYLRDATGARRFWPVRCGKIAVERLEADRDQLFAEAMGAYQAGEGWHADETLTRLARPAQDERQEIDPWEDPISALLEKVQQADWKGNAGPGKITSAEIMGLRGLNIPHDRQHGGSARRVAAIMKKMGWKKERKNTSTGYQRVWISNS